MGRIQERSLFLILGRNSIGTHSGYNLHVADSVQPNAASDHWQHLCDSLSAHDWHRDYGMECG